MKLLLLLALLGAALQESTLPEGAYCINHQPLPSQKNAHACRCDYVCVQGADGLWDYHEDQTCKLYCRKAKAGCLCHPEEACPKPS